MLTLAMSICTPTYLLSQSNWMRLFTLPPRRAPLATQYWRYCGSRVARNSHAAAHSSSSCHIMHAYDECQYLHGSIQGVGGRVEHLVPGVRRVIRLGVRNAVRVLASVRVCQREQLPGCQVAISVLGRSDQIGRCALPSRQYLLGVSDEGRRVPRVAGSEGNRSGSHGCRGLRSHLRSGMALIDDVHVAGRVPAESMARGC